MHRREILPRKLKFYFVYKANMDILLYLPVVFKHHGSLYKHLTHVQKLTNIGANNIKAGKNNAMDTLTDVCYLDHAGATLYSEVQIKNFCDDLLKNIYGNPHSLNYSSKQSSDLVDHVRNRILQHFHTSREEYSLIFTSGATAAINILLETFDWEANVANEKCFVGESTDYNKCGTALGAYVYTQSNHTSVVGGREIAKEKNIPFYCLEYDETFGLMKDEMIPTKTSPKSNSLFVYPAQCNFSGRKYPLSWVRKVQNGILDSYAMNNGSRNSKWFCLLDAATYCSTNDLNLSQVQPDFVCVSFYKIFGYPTGLGALLVKNSSAYVLNKKYFGGGTVEISLPSRNFHQKRKVLHERFEDGTVSFLSIIAIEYGLKTLKRLNLNMALISNHVFKLAEYTVTNLKALKHWNGVETVEIYADTDYDNIMTQGGIVNFNLRRANRQYIGFVEVLHIANLRKIYLRTGCFCNSGACQRHLKLTEADLKLHYQAGHVCGDSMDLINGKPTGSIRVSFGYMTTRNDVDKLIEMIKETFVEVAPQTVSINNISKLEDLKLAKILIYPVKSCGALEVSSWVLHERGLEYDREWMIVTKNGIGLTQKQESKLCLILPKLDLVNRKLTLCFRTSENSITIPIENKTTENQYDLCQSKVCNDRIQAHDCGDEVAEWLCHQLDRHDLRLIRQAKDDLRKSRKTKTDEKISGKLSLSNQAQYLLINNESVKWLQQTLGHDDEIDSDTFSDRFRGNFYINGGTEFGENSWSQITIGKEKFKVEGPCGRCQMICIDQHTGNKNKKPLVALSRALSGRLQFGIYLSHIRTHKSAIVKVGDSITVDSEKKID